MEFLIQIIIQSGAINVRLIAAGRDCVLRQTKQTGRQRAASFCLSGEANTELTPAYGPSVSSHLTVCLLYALINMSIY